MEEISIQNQPPSTETPQKRGMSPRFFRNILLFIAVVLIAGNIGFRLGQKNTGAGSVAINKVLVNTEIPQTQDVDFSLFWEVWDKVERQYIDRSEIDPEEMVYGAISGMVSAVGDPYTVFLSPKENTEFNEQLNGTFEGIGAQLGSKDDRIIVIAPLKDHPAQAAGVRSGDWIISVDDEETFGWTVQEAVTKIRGKKGTTVILNVLHEGEDNPVDISIRRDTIIVKSVEVEFVKLDEDCVQSCEEVAHLELSRFGDQTNDEWNQTVNEIRTRESLGNLKGIVLDVRNNPGGYLQSSIFIASEFIEDGLVVRQENSDGSQETFSVTRVGGLLEVPVVVLINKGSASASEILAGALRDHDRALLIGEKTFGKGSIQTPEDLRDGSGLHITTGKWKLPDGDWINDIGIEPDILIENSEEATDSADSQLERAILELTN